MSEDDPGRAIQSIPASHPNGRRLSHILGAIASDPARERIAIGDLLDTLGHRGYGALIILFATPNLLPVALPGMSSVLGAPLLFLTWQLAAGWPHPWLPALIRERSFERAQFQTMVARLVPALQRIERMVRPRLPRTRSTRSTRTIMISRQEIGWLDVDADNATVRRTLHEHGHARYWCAKAVWMNCAVWGWRER